MDIATIIGLFAGALTTIAFLPQVIKVWKIRETRDLSLTTFLIFTIGVLSWLVYGILTNDLPVIIANALTFVLAGTILAFKIRYG